MLESKQTKHPWKIKNTMFSLEETPLMDKIKLCTNNVFLCFHMFYKIIDLRFDDVAIEMSFLESLFTLSGCYVCVTAVTIPTKKVHSQDPYSARPLAQGTFSIPQ